MTILRSKVLGEGRAGDKTFLALHEIVYEHKGKTRPYFMVTRGREIVPPASKKPDAVVIVAFVDAPNEERRLVVIDEFRPPIQGRDLSFPAGLIDAEDWVDSPTAYDAAVKAAVREMKQETGLDFVTHNVSHPNLYSSAGMTNESVIVVMGRATGVPTDIHAEPSEDIKTRLMTLAEVRMLIDNPDETQAVSKVAWPFLWAFSKMGFTF
jgi:ADP-ribose pyrophosphatase